MFRRLAVVLLACLIWLAVPAAAHAHPLGNFSVNQLGALSLHPSRVDVLAVADLAELPTLQEEPTVDSLGTAAFAARECASLAAAFAVRVDGAALPLAVASSSYAYADGSAGLRTSRLECTLSAPADLSEPSTVEVANGYRADRVGWRELTAVADGVHLVDSPLPTTSRSDGLRSYPDDLLTSPPDVRSARLRVEPGGATAATAGSPGTSVSPALPGWLGRAEATLRSWVGSRDLTLGVGLAAVLLALLLGAAHAALPGHGKTVMAAYLAGRAGRPRDALTVGATVTLTHTGGVLVLGLLLTTAAGLAGETVLGWLGVTSGVLVAALGASMLLSRRFGTHAHSHSHGPGDHSHGPGDHSHGPGDHSHGPGDHSHEAGPHGHDSGDHSHGPGAPAHSHGFGAPAHAHGPGEHSHGPGEHSHGPHSHSHGPGGHDPHAHDHSEPHSEPHSHSRDPDPHDHDTPHDHTDSPPHSHSHSHSHDADPHDHPSSHHPRPSRLAIVGMGVAGGLVPSPSALVVLLGAVGLGRTWFGVLLVLAYGLGMAAVLTAAGLLLIRMRDRWAGRFRLAARLPRLTRLAPTGTAAMVLLVGSALAIRSLVTL